MTTTPDQEERLQLLDALITKYIQHEYKDRNVQDACSDERQEINKKWREIEAEAKRQIQGEPIDKEKGSHNESASKVMQKILQIINATKMLSEAYKMALTRWKDLNDKIFLSDEKPEYTILQSYLRSIASNGKPTLDIFDKIQAAIQGLEPIQELAALPPEDHGSVDRTSLREQLKLFVSELRPILDRGTGSIALD